MQTCCFSFLFPQAPDAAFAACGNNTARKHSAAMSEHSMSAQMPLLHATREPCCPEPEAIPHSVTMSGATEIFQTASGKSADRFYKTSKSCKDLFCKAFTVFLRQCLCQLCNYICAIFCPVFSVHFFFRDPIPNQPIPSDQCCVNGTVSRIAGRIDNPTHVLQNIVCFFKCHDF